MSSVMNTAVTTGAGYSQLAEAVRDVYSAELYFAALPTLKFDQFSTKKTELGTTPGRTITMTKMASLKRGGRLTEGTRMQARAMGMSQQSITVDEYGNAVAFSELLLQVSYFDQIAAASMLLGRDLAVVLDKEQRDTAVGASSVVYAGGKASRATLEAVDKFDTRVIKDAVETLETQNAPKWFGDHYVCFLHPHQARGIRDDANWVNAQLYGGVQGIYTGEIGRYEDVRFISTTVMPNGANSALDPDTGETVDVGYTLALDGAGVGSIDIYQAVMFGEYAYGHATALPVELRDNGVTDYGREHGLGWYSIMGQGRLEANNIVVIETA